jgi:hypothetical protein
MAILSAVPKTIQDALQCPPVTDLIRNGARQADIEACLAVEIARISNMLTVGGNLRQGQSLEIAKALIADFPGESLQDFCLCLRSGVKGAYGDIYRFDVLVISEWFKCYLEEKYKAAEDALMRERDDHYKPKSRAENVDPERHQQWLDKLKGEITDNSSMRLVPNLTEEQIKSEGKAKRKPTQSHDNGWTFEIVERRRKIQRAGSEFYRHRSDFKLQMFVVDGNEIMAESQSDAEAIYLKATQE